VRGSLIFFPIVQNSTKALYSRGGGGGGGYPKLRRRRRSSFGFKQFINLLPPRVKEGNTYTPFARALAVRD